MADITIDDRTRWRQVIGERFPHLEQKQVLHVLREVVRRASMRNTRNPQALGDWLVKQPLSDILDDRQYEAMSRDRSDRATGTWRGTQRAKDILGVLFP